LQRHVVLLAREVGQRIGHEEGLDVALEGFGCRAQAADVGVDEGTSVSRAYKDRDNKFTGKIQKVLVEVR